MESTPETAPAGGTLGGSPWCTPWLGWTCVRRPSIVIIPSHQRGAPRCRPIGTDDRIRPGPGQHRAHRPVRRPGLSLRGVPHRHRLRPRCRRRDPPQLGERLARAIGQGLVSARHECATWHETGARAHGSMTTGTVPSTTVVTVDAVLERSRGAVCGSAVPRGGLRPAPPPHHHPLLHRAVWPATAPATTTGPELGPRAARRHGAGGGSRPTAVGNPGPGRPGHRLPGRPPRLPGRGHRPRLRRQRRGRDRRRGPRPGRPDGGAPNPPAHCSLVGEHLVRPGPAHRLYRSMGIDVLAVSAGAGAGALVGCLDQGAYVLFDLNALPAELLELRRSEPWAASAPWPGRHRPRHPRTPPGPAQADLQ